MKRKGLRRSQTLRERADFLAFFTASQRCRLGILHIFRKASLRQQHTRRLGITLKGRYGSIERNLVKRLIREGFRNSELEQFPLGFDYNFVFDKRRFLEERPELEKNRRRLDRSARWKLKKTLQDSFMQKDAKWSKSVAKRKVADVKRGT